MKRIFLGIDLGGSNASAVLMTGDGHVLELQKIETRAQDGPQRVIERLVELARSVLPKSERQRAMVRGAAVGVPGVLNIATGMVRFAPNLPGWKNIPLQRQLQRHLGMPVVLENDANAAAYGEKWLGAGQGCANMVMYTIGTGIGGGIILNGRIYHGHCDGAGELGHMTILPDGPVCGCGNHGCLEALASGTAIARRMRERLHAAEGVSALAIRAGRDGLNAKMVLEAAKAGDALAEEVVVETATYLGIAVAGIINLLNPQLVILGGGVSVSGSEFLKYVRAEAERRAMKDLGACTKIVRAKLADRAGVYGAAGIAAHASRTHRGGTH